jgi:hypothetical protein
MQLVVVVDRYLTGDLVVMAVAVTVPKTVLVVVVQQTQVLAAVVAAAAVGVVLVL